METGNTSKMWGWQEAGSRSKFCSWQFLLLKLVNIHNITIFFYLLRPAIPLIEFVQDRGSQWKPRFNQFIFIWMCGERKGRNMCLLTSFINLNFPIPFPTPRANFSDYCWKSNTKHTGLWLAKTDHVNFLLASDWSILFQEAAGGVWQARGRAEEARRGPWVRRHRGWGRIQRGERPRGGHGAGLRPGGDHHLHPGRVHRGRLPQGPGQGGRGIYLRWWSACVSSSLSLIKTYFKFLLIDLCHFRCDSLACSCSFCRAAVRKWRWKATSEIWMRKEYSNGISFESIREVNLWSYCQFWLDFWENNIIPSSLLLLLFNTHKNIGLKNSAVSLFSALDVCYRRRERRGRVSSWQSAPLLFTLSDNKFNSHLLTTSGHKESMVCNVDGRDHSVKALFICHLTIFKFVLLDIKLFTVCM